GNGFRKPNNKIGIRHEDGTTAWYLHFKQHGSLVKKGDVLEQGDPVALSGNVGRSMLPHLHFDVTDKSGATVPIRFRDVDVHGGIPWMFERYTSGNRKEAEAEAEGE
ncbi:MAG: M23 family metallopeptidase, partial [Planctomycetota bacterium]